MKKLTMHVLLTAGLLLTSPTAVLAERDVGTNYTQPGKSAKVQSKSKKSISYSRKKSVATSRASTKGARVVGAVRGLHPRLMARLHTISHHYRATVHVTSGCRTRKTNRGVKNSLHLRCIAADIQIHGVSASSLYAHALRYGGGTGRYCGRSFIHTDIGQTRQWSWYCSRKTAKVKLRRRR